MVYKYGIPGERMASPACMSSLPVFSSSPACVSPFNCVNRPINGGTENS